MLPVQVSLWPEAGVPGPQPHALSDRTDKGVCNGPDWKAGKRAQSGTLDPLLPVICRSRSQPQAPTPPEAASGHRVRRAALSIREIRWCRVLPEAVPAQGTDTEQQGMDTEREGPGARRETHPSTVVEKKPQTPADTAPAWHVPQGTNLKMFP